MIANLIFPTIMFLGFLFILMPLLYAAYITHKAQKQREKQRLQDESKAERELMASDTWVKYGVHVEEVEKQEPIEFKRKCHLKVVK